MVKGGKPNPTSLKTPTKHRIKLKKSAKKTLKAIAKRLPPPKLRRRFVKSFTDPVKIYEVTATSCTCPDFLYRRKSRGEKCKHMKALLSETPAKK